MALWCAGVGTQFLFHISGLEVSMPVANLLCSVCKPHSLIADFLSAHVTSLAVSAGVGAPGISSGQVHLGSPNNPVNQPKSVYDIPIFGVGILAENWELTVALSHLVWG